MSLIAYLGNLGIRFRLPRVGDGLSPTPVARPEYVRRAHAECGQV